MATLRSTMNAPLTDEEENEILDAWQRLVMTAQMLRMDSLDQVDMLDRAADLVGHVSGLRSAIHNAWHYANRRAFPGPPPRVRSRAQHSTAQRRPASRLLLEDIAGDITEEQILEALRTAEGNQ